MARRQVNSKSIRDRAFGLACAACPPSNRLLILSWATEYRRYLLWCVASIEPKAVLLRLLGAIYRVRLLTELMLIARQYAVVRRIYNPKYSLDDLEVTIQGEIEARRKALLGDANCPASLSILAKLAHLPRERYQLAVALRELRVDIVSGKVIVRIRTHIRTIAVLYLISLSWLILVFSQMTTIQHDLGNATMVAILAIALLTYLFSPVIRNIAEDMRLQDVVNQLSFIKLQKPRGDKFNDPMIYR